MSFQPAFISFGLVEKKKSRKEDGLSNIYLINLLYYFITYSVRIEDDSILDGEVCNTG